ncbi:MAG: serine/threonine protein kinase, partial [Myxococcales bacterium]|nr:serine/threonine protein kinase [Myxococcales bacterium]
MSPETSRRRYRIQGVIGQGGFGSVYRAHMEGPEGFRKDVAIKLLRDADPPREVLQRFRDEARILGLVRDRAVVTVDPPVRLNGRWAVVMEYVDGVSLRALIEAHGRIPPGPALQIVGEVARALDKLWHQEGPDGSPLSLLHRDLKPANLQLTRAGEVKVLDFGIAKASFSERETTTTNALAGTAGYMAPERLAGSEGPTTDVFSLGIVLWELVLGSRPRLEEVMDDEPLEGELAEVLGLVRRMCAINPEERPSTREVERACRQASRGLEPDLRDWADQAVPEASWADDPMAGTVLTETLLLDPPVTPPPGGRAAWFVGGASLLTLIASGA